MQNRRLTTVRIEPSNLRRRFDGSIGVLCPLDPFAISEIPQSQNPKLLFSAFWLMDSNRVVAGQQ